MSIVMNELAKEIERLKRLVDEQRENLERVDPNNFIDQGPIARAISDLTTRIDCLERFQTKMRERGHE